MHHLKINKRTGQQGFSLVELLIAITIGLIVTTALVQLFVANKQAYRIQEGLLEMQENARFSLHTLTYDIRMADHWGGVEGDAISMDGALAGCAQSLAGSTLRGISGMEGADIPPLPAGCLENEDYVSNSDVLVVRYAAVDERVATSDLNSAEYAGDFLIASVAGFSGIFDTGSGLHTEQSAGGKLHDGDGTMAGVMNYPYHMTAYFIRPCSVKAGAVCASTDDEGEPIPTLTRLVLRGDNMVQEPIAEGVEQMQLEFGIGDAGSVEEYKDADEMGSSDWNRVSAVRLALVTRAGKRDNTYIDEHDAGNVYDLPGNDAEDDYFVTGDDVHYRRKVVTQVVQIRNSGRI